MGLTYLFYGSRTIRECLHRIAVYAQLPPERGGMNTPSILIDSENMLSIETLTHWSFEYGLEPEVVMDNVIVSRAFPDLQPGDEKLYLNQNFSRTRLLFFNEPTSKKPSCTSLLCQALTNSMVVSWFFCRS